MTRGNSLFRPVVAVGLAFALHCPTVWPDETVVDWRAINQELNKELSTDKGNIRRIASDLLETSPQSAHDATFKLCVMVRCGITGESIQALRELKEFDPALDEYQLFSLFIEARRETGDLAFAQAIVEVFADKFSDTQIGGIQLKHFRDSGWPLQKIDDWLSKMPRGTNDYWYKQQLQFQIDTRLENRLADELTARVKANPEDIDAAIMLLEAHKRIVQRPHTTYNFSWMTNVVKPASSTDAKALGSAFVELNDYSTASTYFASAANRPLTNEEISRLGMMGSIPMTEIQIRAGYESMVQEDLAKCLLKLGNNQDAQIAMVKAEDLRVEHHLPRNMSFAGQAQSASGQRTIENRIKKTEAERKQDPDYWLERARYYQGRGLTEEQENAYTEGLSLKVVDPNAGREAKERDRSRAALVTGYASFLIREKRTSDAVSVLRAEFEHSTPDSFSVNRAADFLWFDLENQLDAQDPILWNWLSVQPQWGHVEARLLWELLKRANEDDLNGLFEKAEALAYEKDPDSAFELGWIMNRMGHPQRSLPLLRFALKNAADTASKGRAFDTLVQSEMHCGNWKIAEAMLRTTGGPISREWFPYLAMTASAAGDEENAMRLWETAANMFPARLHGLDDLAKTGLKEKLIEFYGQMQKDMPESFVPERALELLSSVRP